MMRTMILMVLCLTATCSWAQDLSMSYASPADEDKEALMLSNGRQGMMVYGNTVSDTIRLTETSFWTGSPYGDINAGAQESLTEIRKEILRGDYEQAYLNAKMNAATGIASYRRYGGIGGMVLTFPKSHREPANYRRWLDLGRATATVDYDADGTHYRREAFCSMDSKLSVVRLTAGKKGRLSFSTSFAASPETKTEQEKLFCLTKSGAEIMITTRPDNKEDLRCTTIIRIVAEGGKVSTHHHGARLTVSIDRATNATILISEATNHNGIESYGKDQEQKALAPMARIGMLTDKVTLDKKWYDAALQTHINIYKALYDRVTVDLPLLDALYFQYSRYRQICQALTEGDYSTLEARGIDWLSCYWGTDACYTGEAHKELLRLAKELQQRGTELAARVYGCNGWAYSNGISPIFNARLSSMLWEHYLYTADRDFLKDAYPVMKGAARFYQDYLVRDPWSGYMVAAPGTGGIDGVTSDNQMISDLLHNTAMAARMLGVDTALADSLDMLRKLLPPMYVGKDGMLQKGLDDWDMDFLGPEETLHLWGLYPGSLISARHTPELAAAVRKTLMNEAGNRDKLWKSCLWARLTEGERAYLCIEDMKAEQRHDVNYAVAMTEMLVQSYDGAVHLLPALPHCWENGAVGGLLLHGGFVLEEMKWSGHRLVYARIRSNNGGNLRVRADVQLLCSATMARAESNSNPNPFFADHGTAKPVVKDRRKLIHLPIPETFLYDIPTKAGETIELTGR